MRTVCANESSSTSFIQPGCAVLSHHVVLANKIMMGTFSKAWLAAVTVGALVAQAGGQKPKTPHGTSSEFSSVEFLESLKNAERDLEKSVSSKYRELQSSRACNQQFAVVETSELVALVNFFVPFLMINPALFVAAEIFLSLSINYDLAVIKVCLSCADISELDLDQSVLMNDSTYGFQSYCSPDSYGYTAMHSALVFAPIDPSTGEIFSGVLRGFVSGHSSEIDVDAAPTERWPASVSGVLASNEIDDLSKILIFRNGLATSIAASAGAVSIMPDYVGFGESRDFDRAFIAPLPYMQAFAVSYVATKRFLSSDSNGCTVLDDIATAAGYSEGGYASVVGALALQQNGVEILSAHPGGAPWDLDTQLGFAIGLLDSPPLTLAQQLNVALSAYAFSNDFPFLANANSGVNALSAEYSNSSMPLQDVINWFSAPDPLSVPEILLLLPLDTSSIVNPDVLNLYRSSGVLDACREGSFVTALTQPFCNALLDSSLLDAFANDISFDVSICHSPDDDLVSFANVPVELRTIPMDPLPSNIQLYTQPILGGTLEPQGDHNTAFLLCAIDSILTISSVPAGANSPIFMKPLTPPPAQCLPNQTPVPSAVPSPIPSDSPSENPSSLPSPVPSDNPSSLPSLVPSDNPSSSPSEVPSGIPSQDPTPEPCGGFAAICETDDDCCDLYVCVLRRVGDPKLCSSAAIRTKCKKTAAGDGQGGRAGKVKAADCD